MEGLLRGTLILDWQFCPANFGDKTLPRYFFNVFHGSEHHTDKHGEDLPDKHAAGLRQQRWPAKLSETSTESCALDKIGAWKSAMNLAVPYGK